MRFLLRPGWLALIAGAVGFAVACYTLLAPWQFGREAQREAEEQAIETSYRTPPAPLGELIPAGAGVTAPLLWRQARITGNYLPDAEMVVRLRVFEGAPAFEVLTPLRTDDGRVVLVDRGFVSGRSGLTVPAYPPPPAGPVTVIGRLRLDETDPQARPLLESEGHRQIYAADSRQVAAATGLAVEPGRLQLSEGQPGVLTPVPVAPNTGAAPFTNFSYALQWLVFGAIALFAVVYFIRLELLQRRGAQPARARSDRAEQRAAFRRALSGEDPPDPTPPDPRQP